MKNILYSIAMLCFLSSMAIAQIPFTPIDTNFGAKTIFLPKGYGYSTLFIGGVDSVTLANGTKQLSKESQDLIVFIPKNGSSTEGTIYVNHETSGSDATRGNGGGGTVFDVKKGPSQWEVVGNRRKVDFTTVGGTTNNCAGNLAPKGTVFSAEENVPTSNPGLSWGSDTADFGGYKRYLNNGFMVEIDPMAGVALRKCYAMGRYAHEGCAIMQDHKTAYLTEDATPACLFKFVADVADDYSAGQLYAYKQSTDGLSGTWLPIPRHRDSINITKTIALRLGATMFIRLEDCEFGPDGCIYIAETGSDNANLAANELAGNKPALHLEPFRKIGTSSIMDTFGRIIKLDTATGKMSVFLQGGRGSDGITCISNPDNIAIDFKRKLLAFHEDINGTSAGRSLRGLTTCENYYVDMNIANPTVNDAKRFLVCPTSGEATGIWFTPDYETYFVNIQHPATSDFYPFSKATTIAINKTEVKTNDFVWKNPALLGTSSTGMPIYYGALSGLDAIPGVPGGFISLTDRGPNVDADNINGGNAAGIFLLPNFNPLVYELRAEADSIRIVKMLPIKSYTNGAVTGVPLPVPPGGTAADPFWTDLSKTPAGYSNFGIDCEGIVPGLNKDYLICDEYGPSVWSIDQKTGKTLKRFMPYAFDPNDNVVDTVLKKRRNNRGFEGMTFTPKGKIYAILQSPAYNTTSAIGDASQIHRLIEIDPTTGATREFAYLHQPKTANLREKDWKIGDLTAINDYEFLIIEHALRNGEDSKKIYKFDIRNATPITTDNFGGKTLEQLVDAKGLASAGITPVAKSFYMDLLANGYDPINEKPEGLTIITDSTIAVCNDNDFGVLSPNVDGNAVATGIKSHLYVFTVPPQMKLQNFVKIANRVNPRLSITPRSITFDSIPLGTDICKTLTVSNPGTDTVHILANQFSSNDGDFSFIPLTGSAMTLAPGDSRQILVCFKALRSGSRLASIGFKTDIPLTYETFRQDTSFFLVSIKGTGFGLGNLTYEPMNRLDSVAVGKQVCYTVTLKNSGEDIVTVNHYAINGLSASNFTVTGLTSSFSLQPGSTTTFTICGTPSDTGLRQATLTIGGMTAGKILTSNISLAMYAIGTCAMSSPLSLFDGKKIVPGYSDSEIVSVTNCGNLSAKYSISITSDSLHAYSISGAAISPMIPQGGRTSFTIRYSPIVKGTATGIARIASQDVTPMDIQLNGSVANVQISSPSLSIPPTVVGKTSAEFGIVLNNSGDVNWTPSMPTVTGPFSYRSGSLGVIVPGGQSTLQFIFTPTVVGSNAGSLLFNLATPTTQPQVRIDLSGQGLANASVQTDEAGVPLIALENPSPNPFSTSTKIAYSIARPTKVLLTITSIDGRELSRLIDATHPAGSYETSFNSSDLSNGTYICTLSTASGSISKAVTVQR